MSMITFFYCLFHDHRNKLGSRRSSRISSMDRTMSVSQFSKSNAQSPRFDQTLSSIDSQSPTKQGKPPKELNTSPKAT